VHRRPQLVPDLSLKCRSWFPMGVATGVSRSVSDLWVNTRHIALTGIDIQIDRRILHRIYLPANTYGESGGD
jgi:hypothetical protein